MSKRPINRLRVAAVLAALLLASSMLLAGVTVADKGNSKGNASNKGPTNKKPTFPNEDDDGGTAGVQVTPNSGTTRTVSVSVTSSDGNGHADYNKCEFTVYKPGNATVHISTFAGSKATGSGQQAKYGASFNMKYWHDPGTYHVKAKCQDRKSSADTSWQTFKYQELTSVSMNVTKASFEDSDGDGDVDPGDITHNSPVNVSITNAGNVKLDIAFNGTDAGNGAGDYFNVSDFHLDADQDGSFSTNEWKFKYAKQTVTTFNLKPSADGTASTKFVLFAIHVPNVPKGTYTGQFFMEAVKG